jgi:hypothetical protein
MPSLSSLKHSVVSAFRTPHEGNKSHRRRVIPFNEALENLKTSQSGVVTCAAFHFLGKCHKEITLFDSDFLSNLDQLNMADVQTPMKLMPLMLCSTHWERTVYHNELFLDWLSIYGSKKSNQQFENIVVDYQSAIAIDDEGHHLSEVPISSELVSAKQGTPASAPNHPTRGKLLYRCSKSLVVRRH